MLFASIAHDIAPIVQELTIRAKASESNTIIPDGIQLRVGTDEFSFELLRRPPSDGFAGSSRSNGSEIYERRHLEDLANQIRPRIVGPLHMPAFYLPAGRTGAARARSAVVSAQIESAAMTGLRPAARAPMLSSVLADFLERLIDLDSLPYRRRKTRSKYVDRLDYSLRIDAARRTCGAAGSAP